MIFGITFYADDMISLLRPKTKGEGKKEEKKTEGEKEKGTKKSKRRKRGLF